jgi:hypothetical protein
MHTIEESALKIIIFIFLIDRDPMHSVESIVQQYFSMDEKQSCNFLKNNFSSQSSIQITLKNYLKYLKITFSLVFVGRLRLKVALIEWPRLKLLLQQ